MDLFYWLVYSLQHLRHVFSQEGEEGLAAAGGETSQDLKATSYLNAEDFAPAGEGGEETQGQAMSMDPEHFGHMMDSIHR